MQGLSVVHPLPHVFLVADEFSSIPAKFDQDFTFNIKINHEEEQQQQQEFTFACSNPHGTLVSADEIFDNGKIRPIFPIFDPSLLLTNIHDGVASLPPSPLKKVFVQKQCNVLPFVLESQGAPCKTMTFDVELEDLNEKCKKNNSTGFSKLWRFRRSLELRSNSDGKDAFVFLNPQAQEKLKKPYEVEVKNNLVKKGKKCRTTLPSSVFEKLYVMKRKTKESNKQRSFLPYNCQLVGFFTNVNGLSKNVHPF